MDNIQDTTKAQDWATVLIPALQICGILVIAWLARKFSYYLIAHVGSRYHLRDAIALMIKRFFNGLIVVVSFLFVLDILGVSATVLWTVFTGFAAVAAVAFFAAWSVLSNICCAFLILMTRSFALYDYIELLENGEKPGLKGQVIDMNLVYITLREEHTLGDTVLQIPNNLFFQRTVRRWRNGSKPEFPRNEPNPLATEEKKTLEN